MITTTQIARDLELARKATPGPWWVKKQIESCTFVHANTKIADVYFENEKANVEFIARARTALPEYAETLREAMRLLESRFGAVYHVKGCGFDGINKALCTCHVEEARDFITTYHAQEKPE